MPMPLDQSISVYEEHLFWIEILGDHAHFLFDNLSPSETPWIRQAGEYIRAFRQARQDLEQLPPDTPVTSEAMKRFSAAVYPTALGYFQLEGTVQSRRLLNQINVNLTPTYFNGTLNENQEYLRLLGYYIRGQAAPELPLVGLLSLWLEDQLGHAVLLRNVLDPVEAGLSEKSAEYARTFEAHMIKNQAIQRYLRFIQPGFPAQQQFASEVFVTVEGFYRFVQTVIARYRHAQVITRTTLRFLEHHLPETCYFLRKLAYYKPDLEWEGSCPLTKPSFPLNEGGLLPHSPG